MEDKKTGTEEKHQQSTYSERKQEFVGKIFKCPSCGAQLSSFTAICPDCGHEINSQNVSSSLKEFIEEINEYDKVIANNSDLPKSGWKTWKHGKRILWVIINLFTSFIPLVIYLTLPLIKPFLFAKSVPELSADEKRKASLIENYVFPNEREATLEAMMFTQSKMAFLASEKFDKKTLYWTNLWNTKAEQLNQRAGIILAEDKIIEKVYSGIIASKNKVDRIVKIRAVIGITIIVAYVAIVLNNVSLWTLIEDISNIKLSSTTLDDDASKEFEWPTTGLCTHLPRPDSNKGEIHFNDDEKFWIDIYDFSQSDYEHYIEECKEKGFTIDGTKTSMQYEAYNEEGYYLNLMYLASDSNLDITITAPKANGELEWPSIGMATLIPKPQSTKGTVQIDTHIHLFVYVGETTKEDYKKYVSDCIDKGFNIDYSRSENVYAADNKHGDSLRVEYEGNNIMSISMYAKQ